jgi:hypothetical protein
LDHAAVNGVSKEIFKPGMEDGRAANARREVPMVFDPN